MKIYNERYSDFESMIKRYEREMRETYENKNRGINSEEPMINDGVFPNEKEPSFVSEQIEAENQTVDDSSRDSDYEDSPASEDDKGYIIVITNSGRGAVPLEGVNVVVDRVNEDDPNHRQELVKILSTNSSGRTSKIEVSTVGRRLSQVPGNPGPFATYYVSANLSGYIPVRDQPVDVFGGETSLLKIELVPEPEDLGGGKLW